MANLSSRETVTIAQAKAILRSMADRQSVLLLAGPGVGKSDCVYQAAADAGLPCRSLVGTQIAPEDVSGIPRIVGERSVFCPPRVLLPEEPTPFCLFLDELPACAPDIQKAFYSLLLERRIGEHPLPPGTWVVAAGNRVEDRSLVRALSSALVNRVILLHVRVDFEEWMTWAHGQKLRAEVLSYLQANPESLARPVPAKPSPFSTPRSWASLARALDRVEAAGHLTPAIRLALAAGRVSPEDALGYCVFAERREMLAAHERFPQPIVVPILLSEAKALLTCLADSESLLLQAAPGVGKTAIVAEAAAEAGLPCRSLLGTQIAPEDVSGIPRIVGERSVFCPPRVLLPEDPGPFCLFLDELPACSPDVQKAFYPLLLERRLGEHELPEGSWVVAAGNRVEDRALVREMSAAMVNRLFLLSIRVDAAEWFAWAERNAIRQEVVLFLRTVPEALLRPVPTEPVPFSTPRAWAMLADSLDRAEHSSILDRSVRRALAFGRVSAEDAAMFCAITEEAIANLQPIGHYVEHPEDLPKGEAARWFLINRIRKLVESGNLKVDSPGTVNRFFRQLSQEHRLMLLVDLVKPWADLGAEDAMFDTLLDVTGISR
jgi:MoxR-like ATPase